MKIQVGSSLIALALSAYLGFASAQIRLEANPCINLQQQGHTFKVGITDSVVIHSRANCAILILNLDSYPGAIFRSDLNIFVWRPERSFAKGKANTRFIEILYRDTTNITNSCKSLLPIFVGNTSPQIKLSDSISISISNSDSRQVIPLNIYFKDMDGDKFKIRWTKQPTPNLIIDEENYLIIEANALAGLSSVSGKIVAEDGLDGSGEIYLSLVLPTTPQYPSIAGYSFSKDISKISLNYNESSGAYSEGDQIEIQLFCIDPNTGRELIPQLSPTIAGMSISGNKILWTIPNSIVQPTLHSSTFPFGSRSFSIVATKTLDKDVPPLPKGTVLTSKIDYKVFVQNRSSDQEIADYKSQMSRLDSKLNSIRTILISKARNLDQNLNKVERRNIVFNRLSRIVGGSNNRSTFFTDLLNRYSSSNPIVLANIFKEGIGIWSDLNKQKEGRLKKHLVLVSAAFEQYYEELSLIVSTFPPEPDRVSTSDATVTALSMKINQAIANIDRKLSLIESISDI